MGKDVYQVVPEGVEARSGVYWCVNNLGDGAEIVGEFSPTGGLRISEEFVDLEIFDILIGVDKILVVPEEGAKKRGEIEEETNEGEEDKVFFQMVIIYYTLMMIEVGWD